MNNDDVLILINAIKEGDTAKINAIIEGAAEGIEPRTYNIETAIRMLMQRGYYFALDLLIEKEILFTDLYEYDRFDNLLFQTLLKPQLPAGETLEHYLKWLKSYFQAIDDIDEEVGSTTLLEYALKINAPVAVLKAMVQAGATINRLDAYGHSLLYKACQARVRDRQYARDLIAWLLEAGIDPNLPSETGKTALHAAIEEGKAAEAIQLMEAGADANIADKEGETAFFYAATGQHNPNLLEKMLSLQSPDLYAKNQQGAGLLNAYFQAMPGDSGERAYRIIDLLLAAGADIKAASTYYSTEKTGVDWLLEKPESLLKQVIETGYLEADYRDNQGNTLLHKACMVALNHDEQKAKDLYRKVKYLLKKGVDPGIENLEDKKAVDYTMTDNLKVKSLELLLSQ